MTTIETGSMTYAQVLREWRRAALALEKTLAARAPGASLHTISEKYAVRQRAEALDEMLADAYSASLTLLYARYDGNLDTVRYLRRSEFAAAVGERATERAERRAIKAGTGLATAYASETAIYTVELPPVPFDIDATGRVV